MKSLILCSTLFLLFSCTGNQYIYQFEQSNAFFLERTASKVDLNKMMPFISTKDYVMIRSLEETNENDQPLLALIEDRLIEKMVKMGCTILERDKDILHSLIKESGKKGFQFYGGKSPVSSKKTLEKTSLPAATKLISYRVEEFGIKYRPHMNNRSLKIREGALHIHIRVQDVATGQILYASTHPTLLYEDVSEKQIDMEEQITYSAFTHKYPVSATTDTVKKIVQLEPETVSPFDAMKWYTEPQFVLRSGAGTGFGMRYGLTDSRKRLTAKLYYSVSETNHYSFSAIYDRMFSLPEIMSMADIKLNTQIGATYINNQSDSGIGLLLGGGIECSMYEMTFHLGWNHTIPFQKTVGLWGTDFILSISMSY